METNRDENGKILVTRSSLPSYEEYIEMIKPIWDSAWLTNMGEFHQRLEQELKEYMDMDRLVLFVNGHMALEMAIQALELTGEVITTPFTFASTTHAIVRNGLTPVFCDIRPEDYTMDPDKIEALITERTSAIIPVHVYGNLCDVERIDAIAKKHGLKVIYDAAHTFGERYQGRSVGEFGDASIFSFHATKVFNTIEGGAVAFKEPWMEHRLNCLKNYGIVDSEHVVWVGGNAKMNEFQAAMGLCNLRHVDREIEKRRLVCQRYMSHLKGVPGLKLPRYQEGLTPNYAYFPVVFDGFALTRDQVYECLARENIYARKYFYPLTSQFQCYEGRFPAEETPVALWAADRVLTLPCYADLALEEVDRICRIILKPAGFGGLK
ncbi:MAG: DegT/DnrJ/EryC1/StrS family aminotransferase [Clostridiales bacterium]|nr:DegT/DnrJ/EryC1/StrS family aminotransferase [Clostridiales bacterium]